VKEFGIEKRISDRPHAMLWLFKTYALSAGMYASQICSMQVLEHNNVFSNPLQVTHMAFLKRILRVNLLLQTGECSEIAHRNSCNFTGSGQLSNFGTGLLFK
jgi:hypothetical protein